MRKNEIVRLTIEEINNLGCGVGHLSNADSAEFCAELAEKGLQSVLLAHLSEENNEPSIALNETLCAVGDDGVCICVASPDCPTKLKRRNEGGAV